MPKKSNSFHGEPKSSNAHRFSANNKKGSGCGQTGGKRILLASANLHLSSALTRRLSKFGHRVWAVTAAQDAPGTWSPGLYDVVVFTVDGTTAMLRQISESARRIDPRLLLVMLASEPVAVAGDVPDAVITASEDAAIAEQLLAIVNGSVPSAA